MDPAEREIHLVHLGIGAFHRAHQAYYTERCGEWGICGVTERSEDVRRQLGPQDGLYTLTQRSSSAASVVVIGAVREVLFARHDPLAVVARIADPRVHTVTVTVTEKGYRYDPVSGRLHAGDAEIAADLAGRPPLTVVGQIAAGIASRAAAGAPPLTVISCDNIPANGALLSGLVSDFLLRAHPGGAAEWLAGNVSFPSTMVDRIVPATTDADRERVAAELGLRDEGAVVAEPFTEWVIEDAFAGERPAWERAGATLTSDVGPYEQLKLRMLNGTHSALAYLGGLAGHLTIAEAVADPGLSAYARQLMSQDIEPSLTPPNEVDLGQYREIVLGRFANTAVRHSVRQVAIDGSHKLPLRLLGTIRDRRAAGGQPVLAALAVAAWMRHVLSGRDELGRPFRPDDPMLPTIRARIPMGSTASTAVDGLLAISAIFGELGDDAWLRRTLAEQLADLTVHRTRDVIRSLLR
ncbi:MAG TPA: mannitol dehydrogenase family protein [Trebonia sp.]|nr:mannitol dehydrogenase family protein [Trebonia sp.]